MSNIFHYLRPGIFFLSSKEQFLQKIPFNSQNEPNSLLHTNYPISILQITITT